MTENEWTTFVQALLNDELVNESLEVRALEKLPYAMEVRYYRGKSPEPPETMDYQTDLMIVENGPDSTWKPRLIIELKVRTVTIRDAITYSQKAFSHKSVHPYLRYGILMADRRHYLSAPTTGTPASIQQTTREGVDMSKLGVDGKRKPGVKFEKIKEQLMKDEEFRVEYDKLKPRYEVISQIIEERNAQRLTQEELAFRVGTQKSNISRFESGSYNPSLDFLVKVAKSLGKEVHIEIR